MTLIGSDKQPPLLAKVICILTVYFAGWVLLRVLHILPYNRAMLTALAQRPGMLLPALNFVESIILLVAAFLLWRMSKQAFKLFLLELVMEIGQGIYLSFVAPVDAVRSIKLRDPIAVLIGFGLVLIIGGFRCVYAWWVTKETGAKPEQTSGGTGVGYGSVPSN